MRDLEDDLLGRQMPPNPSGANVKTTDRNPKVGDEVVVVGQYRGEVIDKSGSSYLVAFDIEEVGILGRPDSWFTSRQLEVVA